jgi:hypothetical protein
MSGISSGATGLNRAIAGYTEKIQISLCLLDKGAWLQIGESGSDTQIYYWLRVYWLQVKRVGLRRPVACDLKRSLRTFRTRSGVSSTSLIHHVFCSGFYRRLAVAIPKTPNQKTLSFSVASWFQPFNFCIPDVPWQLHRLLCALCIWSCYGRLPDLGDLFRSLFKAWDRAWDRDCIRLDRRSGDIEANLQFAPS